MSDRYDAGAQRTAGLGSITLRLPQALAGYADGQRELTIEPTEEVSLRQVLDELARSRPAVARRIRDESGQLRRFVNVYVGEDECRTIDGLETMVQPGATILVAGSVAGG